MTLLLRRRRMVNPTPSPPAVLTSRCGDPRSRYTINTGWLAVSYLLLTFVATVPQALAQEVWSGNLTGVGFSLTSSTGCFSQTGGTYLEQASLSLEVPSPGLLAIFNAPLGGETTFNAKSANTETAFPAQPCVEQLCNLTLS